ncbi:hypothetical protein CHCC15337_4501 [Bacillus paralicheniformis]|nr:hypothetical protein CHCC15337_4501 [Bacillus paralicheniformis]TWN69039.1 hypothetical protein CHCC14427_3026 [Bacillus paralicheniformis]
MNAELRLFSMKNTFRLSYNRKVFLDQRLFRPSPIAFSIFFSILFAV